ncbi:MAG TPA: type II restriction endonuclease [Pyrinomonadaceae bacterium]|nr:type II restriction endonuclease [Pyrinomonadaceae bacterium]
MVAVDLPNMGSNQHELNGVNALREFFGTTDRSHGMIAWHYFTDDQDPVNETTDFSFYDARENIPTRSAEWRMYYSGSFLARAKVGDRLYIARSQSGQLFGLVFEDGSAWLRAAESLFGHNVSTRKLFSIPRNQLERQELELLRGQILDQLNLSVVIPATPTDEQIMVDRYSSGFPSTKEMALFARTQVEVDLHDPDETLVRWLNREEELFRALEKVIIGDRLRQGFEDVDDFIQYSLSVQNRRKSRMGFALQNHLAEIFTQNNVRFSPQARTEGNNRPDFLFPGEAEYRNERFDADLLAMLGVKSTSKDRWRQVLDEADRISNKHLCTLEPAISRNQTDAMRNRQLTLVVPDKLLPTYSQSQRREIMNIRAFIDFVRTKQVTF